MDADQARQRQQRDRLLQRDLFAIHAARQRGPARLHLLVLAVLAALHIQPIGATPHGDRLAGFGIGPELAHAVLQHLTLGLADLHREAARVLAGGIVRAADEAAVAPELEPDPPVAA